MPHRIPRLFLAGLAVALALGARAATLAPAVVSQEALTVQRRLEPARAKQARSFLQARATALGFGPDDALTEGRAVTNPQGQAVVRFQQTHQGARVFGASATVRVQGTGQPELLVSQVQPGIKLAVPPVLSADQAIRAAHRDLAPLGAYAVAPSAELIVFPSRFATGMKVRYDSVKGASWDRDGSVLAPRPAAPYVWAYEVVSVLRNSQDGVRDMHAVVDARTGDVLRKWNAAPAFLARPAPAAPARGYASFARTNAPLAVESARPAFARPASASPLLQAAATAPGSPNEGLGRGYYNRNVTIATSPNAALGGFDLLDPTRALNPHVWWDGSSWTGNVTAFYDLANYAYTPYTMDNGAGSPDNYWGDGFTYMAPAPVVDTDGTYWAPLTGFHYQDANGQTAAVDAHFAATMTYDMYRNVLGRVGIDGQDTGMMSIVHYRYWYDNAQWSTYDAVMIYGDGTFPFDPAGDRSLTSLDIGAHEMSHGVMGATANLDYQYESGGLNEANSDIFAEAVVAYARRNATDPVDRIPAVSLGWTMAPEVNPTLGPLRFFKRPSLDGISQDAWFYGMSMLDVHYTSGPGNRMFYFLSSGASGDPAATDHSPYLPGGMTGIGIDAAIRIWYKALTERFTSTTDYAAAREGALLAAADLHGVDSAEYAAVENAFAAINVGPAHGLAPRPLVTFPADLVGADTAMGAPWIMEGAFSRTPVVPSGETVRLTATVDHATDPSVTWKAGIGKGFFAPNGTRDPLDVTAANGAFDDNGLYHAPRNAPAWCGVRASSKQDPLEFAASMVFVANLDSDGDTEVDAVDAAVLALTWGLSPAATAAIATFPDPESIGLVDDLSVQLWAEGFKNAFEK